MHTSEFYYIKSLLIKNLGTPYYESDKCLLFNGDTLSLLDKINEKLFDLIITSPPYNIGKEYEKIMPVDKYIEWSINWITKSSNILKNNASLLLNLGYIKLDNRGRAVPLPYILWDKIPLYLNQEIVWNYSAGVACKNYLSPRNEKILWYVKDKDNYIFNLDNIRDKNVKYPNSKRKGKSRVNSLGKNPSDVWEIAKVTTGKDRSSKERTRHPCQFPMDLVSRLVLGFSNIESIIFDPFVGSGTTFEACIKYDRFCIGFEIKKDYCDIAKHRIKNSYINSEQIFLDIL